VRELQPQAKFILTLCDPVKRMYSDYYFLDDNLRPVRPGKGQIAAPGATEKSARQFHERVVAQVNGFTECVNAYMEILVPQYEAQKRVPPSPSMDIGLLGLKDPLHRQYPQLWFRASQM
jgi:hypothetical protein